MEPITTVDAEALAQDCRLRACYYQFLARLFYEELTDEFIDEFVATQQVLPLGGEATESERAFAQGSNRMLKYLQRKTPDTLTQTRCDFAHTFLGAGSVTKVPVSPFESVYADDGRLIMQGSRDVACALYAAEGLEVRDSYNMPEDHVSFEFQYMALLLNRQAEALESRGAEGAEADARAEAYGLRARNFFADHLAPWVPVFCEEAAALASTAFYRGLLQTTAAWMALEGDGYGLDAADVQRDVRERANEAHAAADANTALLHGALKEVA